MRIKNTRFYRLIYIAGPAITSRERARMPMVIACSGNGHDRRCEASSTNTRNSRWCCRRRGRRVSRLIALHVYVVAALSTEGLMWMGYRAASDFLHKGTEHLQLGSTTSLSHATWLKFQRKISIVHTSWVWFACLSWRHYFMARAFSISTHEQKNAHRKRRKTEACRYEYIYIGQGQDGTESVDTTHKVGQPARIRVTIW